MELLAALIIGVLIGGFFGFFHGKAAGYNRFFYLNRFDNILDTPITGDKKHYERPRINTDLPSPRLPPPPPPKKKNKT